MYTILFVNYKLNKVDKVIDQKDGAHFKHTLTALNPSKPKRNKIIDLCRMLYANI